jgi:hypothetical protein
MDEQYEAHEGAEPGQSVTEEHAETHLERDDERFNYKRQMKDWFTLLLMIAVYLAWAGIVYLFEPGIR